METQTTPQEPIVFAIAGLPGSGKSTAAEIIVSELQGRYERATHEEVSDFCRTLYEEEVGGSPTDNELGRWTAGLKNERGQGYILREMSKTLRGDGQPHTVISGLRSPKEAEAVRNVFGHFNVVVLAIWTLPDIRFERKYGDEPLEGHPKWETFIERDSRELDEWGCREFFHESGPTDYYVPNNNGLVLFENRLQHIVSEEVSNEKAHQMRDPLYDE